MFKVGDFVCSKALGNGVVTEVGISYCVLPNHTIRVSFESGGMAIYTENGCFFDIPDDQHGKDIVLRESGFIELLAKRQKKEFPTSHGFEEAAGKLAEKLAHALLTTKTARRRKNQSRLLWKRAVQKLAEGGVQFKTGRDLIILSE